ncbi:MAG: hypothetical protein RIR76_1653 [Verrucomicrobiota bacterium]|jgi:hypothetical protein
MTGGRRASAATAIRTDDTLLAEFGKTRKLAFVDLYSRMPIFSS